MSTLLPVGTGVRAWGGVGGRPDPAPTVPLACPQELVALPSSSSSVPAGLFPDSGRQCVPLRLGGVPLQVVLTAL